MLATESVVDCLGQWPDRLDNGRLPHDDRSFMLLKHL